MNLLARLLERHLPGIARERILEELVAATAAGFDCRAPATEEMTYDERLAAYARFTREEAERVIARGDDLSVVQSRLRAEAYALGRRLRGPLGIEGTTEALAIARPLYRAIGIDFQGDPDGTVTIGQCFFADYYSPEVCRLISALDEGVLAGLASGGHLVFSQRLTEGCDACRARFVPEEAAS
jgi:hypothetical protein